MIRRDEQTKIKCKNSEGVVKMLMPSVVKHEAKKSNGFRPISDPSYSRVVKHNDNHMTINDDGLVKIKYEGANTIHIKNGPRSHHIDEDLIPEIAEETVKQTKKKPGRKPKN